MAAVFLLILYKLQWTYQFAIISKFNDRKQQCDLISNEYNILVWHFHDRIRFIRTLSLSYFSVFNWCQANITDVYFNIHATAPSYYFQCQY